GLEGGEVLDVKVAEGDTVSVGQSLMEMEAEKSTVEVPAPEAGRIAKLTGKKGDQIKVGQTLCVIADDASGEKAETPKNTEREATEQKTDAGQKPPKAAKQPADERTPSQTKAEGNGKREKPSAKGVERPATPATGAPRLVPAGTATRRLARELGVDLSRV